MKFRYYIIGFLVLGLLYFVLGSMDCEPPSLARFAVPDTAPVSDEDNVYFGIVAATNALHHSGIRSHHDLAGLSAEEEEAFLVTNAETVAAVLQASRRSVWRVPREGLVSTPNVITVYTLANICGMHGRRQLARGDLGAATETVRALLALGRKISHDAESDLAWWTGKGFAEVGDKLAMKIAFSAKATPEELRALMEVLRETPAATWRKNLQRAVKTEMCVMYPREMYDAFASRNPFSGMMGGASAGWDALWSVAKPFAYHPNRTLKLLARRLDKALVLMDRNFDEAAWDAAIDRDEDGWIESIATSQAVPNFIGRQSAAGFGGILRRFAKEAASAEFHHSGAEAAVAVALYERANGGAVPKTLAELVPDYLPAVPKDPFCKDAEVGYDAASMTISSAVGKRKMPLRPEMMKPIIQ